MKRLTLLLSALVMFSAIQLSAKPKVDVHVKVDTYFGKHRATGNLSSTLGSDTTFAMVYYLNVTVLSDDAQAVAKNNGQWCITGDTSLVPGTDYRATLDGGSLNVEIPQKDGKILKKSFLIFDRKWRKVSEL